MSERRICTNCGAYLKPGGRPSSTGRHYCTNKAKCVAARQRDQYHRAERGTRPDAPTQCNGCGKSLKPRKVRFGDTELGRWCTSRHCQRRRQDLAAQIEAKKQDAGNANLVVEFLNALKNPNRVVDCEECGLEGAVTGFIHPNLGPDGQFICRALGDQGVKKELAELRWPKIFAAVSS